MYPQTVPDEGELKVSWKRAVQTFQVMEKWWGWSWRMENNVGSSKEDRSEPRLFPCDCDSLSFDSLSKYERNDVKEAADRA